MAISQRLRFEILRRDNHACRYCGATAPDVKLHVDHVIPTTLGGTDDPTNLVAACAPCNTGKASTSPDEAHVQEADSRAYLWAAAMKVAADERLASYDYRESAVADFLENWNVWTWTDSHGEKHTIELPADYKKSILNFYAAGLTSDDLAELVEFAMASKIKNRWVYFCGCAWNRVREAQARASEIVTGWEDSFDGA